MLCAQHALNSLLQGNYFTAPDLAAIANSFDMLEHNALESQPRQSGSHNMDDTGFFSVQVIDKALDVWGLSLVRWRSEQMRPYQDAPHKQLAFVLNLEQHWFTLRRFGPAQTSADSDPGEGHWFNLNSSYDRPKWVSRTYLDMFLRQSEEEGYSVFAVVQEDPNKPLALPRTEVDLAAATLDSPDTTSSIPGAFPSSQGAQDTSEVVIPDEGDFDINNEDVELQAALAASLSGADHSFGQHAYVPQAPVPAPALRRAPTPPGTRSAPLVVDDDDDDMIIESAPPSAIAPSSATPHSDPVAASMARNAQMLERMRRMQEAALRETYEDEVSGRRPPSQLQRTREEQEQEELERAIAASVAEHNNSGNQRRTPILLDEGDDADGEWVPEEDADEGDKENVNAPTRRSQPTRASPGTPGSSSTPGTTAAAVPPTQYEEVHRVYDDEDEQLQEALRASLRSMPEGFAHPSSPARREPSKPVSVPAPDSLSAPVPVPAPESTNQATGGVDSAGSSQQKSSEEELEDEPPAPPAQVDVEEMRRRRLARFGG
ncbi:Josephin-domain-containing protein [Fomitiporia mediterranea MF3/22]|uniref:Josephin-domain-containing protein n=1 Tax=Fomitiporia mediterranea (strain MF3/22) TaxID=694068 RepID=UPI00044075FC|nr:Josephin-domain-containing protein [Fomitiporia mediterranea MF3/22]EJD03337.1 Josephin-domain-containing protein [Fomitiporia mediterranea MF3/22]